MNIWTILLAVLIFGFLIFIHELGHFIAARRCGVEILEFAIGMGPKLFSIKSKKSGTVYSLRIFPIGGYVSMLGENGMEAVQGSSTGETAGEDEWSLVNDPDAAAAEPSDKPPVEAPIDPERARRAYCNQSVWKRILISVAGPFMNVLLGFLLMLVMVLCIGQRGIGTTEVAEFFITYSAEVEQFGFQTGDYLYQIDDTVIRSHTHLTEVLAEKAGQPVTVYVDRLSEDGTEIESVKLENLTLDETFWSECFTYSLSEQSGLRTGDVIVRVNSTSVHTYNELAYEIMNQGYRPMKLTVLREGERVVLENVIVPSYVDSGVTFGDLDFRVWAEREYNAGIVIKHTWYRSLSTVKMVFDSLSGLFSGRYGVEAVSGPVGITKTISEAAQTGFLNVLYLVIVISINLGVMNLLPLPALDGGHLLIYLIEVIRRKPMKKELEAIINFVGLVALLALAVIIAIKDIIAL